MPSDEFSSQITDAALMRPLRDLMGIKGTKEVPENLDVRDIKVVANIFDMYSTFTRRHVAASTAINGMAIYGCLVIGDGGIFLDTRDMETLIISCTQRITFDAAGSLAHAGNNNYMRVQYETGVPDHHRLHHSELEVDTQGNVLNYLQSMGGFRNMANTILYQNLFMYPWLPSGDGIYMEVTTNAVWPANTTVNYEMLLATVPKGSKLPSL